MSPNALENDSETAQRAIVVGVLLYFALWIYASVQGDQNARIAAYVLFAFIAMGVGALLLTQSRSQSPAQSGSSGRFPVVAAAGACLLAGGIAQLGWVATWNVTLEVVSSLAVFVGIVLYVYAVWIAE